MDTTNYNQRSINKLAHYEHQLKASSFKKMYQIEYRKILKRTRIFYQDIKIIKTMLSLSTIVIVSNVSLKKIEKNRADRLRQM